MIAPATLIPERDVVIRAPTDGIVRQISDSPGHWVHAAQQVCELENHDLEARLVEVQGELASALVDLDVIELTEPAKVGQVRARVGYLRAKLAELRRRLASMRVLSPDGGAVQRTREVVYPGMFVREGDPLLHVHAGKRQLVTLLTEEAVARARLEIGTRALVRWSCDPGSEVAARVVEVTRVAREEVPVELTMLVGGQVYARPSSDNEDEAVADSPYLRVVVEPESIPADPSGARLTARVRLAARRLTLGDWLERRVRLFLSSWESSA